MKCRCITSASPMVPRRTAQIMPRIGIAVRYIAPEVVQKGAERQIVQLVRGKDDHGNFEIVPHRRCRQRSRDPQGSRSKGPENFMPEVKPK